MDRVELITGEDVNAERIDRYPGTGSSWKSRKRKKQIFFQRIFLWIFFMRMIICLW